jgi:gliding motility-associated-like protein
VTDEAKAFLKAIYLNLPLIIKLLKIRMYKLTNSVFILLISFFSSISFGQELNGDFNPYVNSGNINPSILKTAQEGGRATFSFNFGNSGKDSLSELKLILNITLSGGVPDNSNPLDALSGTAKALFTWNFHDHEYTGTQIDTINPGFSGTIIIAYRVTDNSTENNSGNGFRAELKPGPYQSTNIVQDDQLSLYTWTQCTKPKPPVIGTITQPTCANHQGSIVLNDLPEGSWIVTVSPGGKNIQGNTTTATITDLSHGTYTFTVSQGGCTSDNSANAVVDAPPGRPDAPVINSITQPSCNELTGSVVLAGLPEGSWTLTRSPGSTTYPGSTATYTVNGLSPGTYTFTVTYSGCTSEKSGNVVINTPSIPARPNIETVTQPTCTVATGSVTVNGLPSSSWVLILYPGENTSTGSSSSTTISNLNPGTYYFRVRAGDCTSDPSENFTISTQPAAPNAPVPGTITPPTCMENTGSVVLNGLPSSGRWTLTRNPGAVSTTGSGTSTTIPGLAPGTYSFTVSTSAECVSPASSDVIIPQSPASPGIPIIGTITQPTCIVTSGSVGISGLPDGPWTLTRSPGAVKIENSGSSYTDTGLNGGTYTYRVTNQQGCTSGNSEEVIINDAPNVPAAPEQRINCALGFGSALVTVTSPTGFGLEYRLDNGIYQSSRIFAEVSNGSHSITVRNAAGCATTGNSFTVSCGCVNGPSINLSSRAGTTCGVAPFTLNDNTFGGNATSVTITENGNGSVSPGSISSSPFSFTYTPSPDDIGNVVTITFTTDNPFGQPCSEAIVEFSLTVNRVPSSPIPGNIIQPNCTSSTGGLSLSGLPASEIWTVTRTPGNVSTTGNGTSTTISGLNAGTYTFTVTNPAGCTSASSSQVVINPQPEVPSAPIAGTITHPTCLVATGSVQVTGLPAGSWSLTRYPGTVATTGTGSSTLISNLSSGTYNFTVTSSGGCTSAASSNIVINPQPQTPLAPVADNITAPTCPKPLGTVFLKGLPAGPWTITRLPDNVTLAGSGQTATIADLITGIYTFTVTSAAGCTSAQSASIIIPAIPDAPTLKITAPAPVCEPGNIDLTAPSVTAGSTEGLTLTYWKNQAATIALDNPATVSSGIYYIKGTTPSSCFDIEPVTVLVKKRPEANAGPDQVLDFLFEAQITASDPAEGETGIWSVYSGSGVFLNPLSSKTRVIDLSIGRNVLLWTLSDKICPSVSDSAVIVVHDLNVPTLLTPNNDGRNEYFILTGIEKQQNNELQIFDRRGARVFEDKDYHNDWNGVDYNNHPLQDDTYFYVIKTGSGRSKAGYVVIRH